MKLRVLIADDEPLSRERLREFIQHEPDAQLVAECATGLEALASIRESHPDVVLLDIKMPGLDGFGVVESLAGASGPAIIFVTGYDQFAIRAFEANAVDYLLKPFDRVRFQTAFRRARERLGQKTSAPRCQVNGKKPARRPFERLAIKSGGRITVVKPAEIDWVGAADNYVELHVGRATHVLRRPISALASHLAPTRFARISRSLLVNLDRIKEICARAHGDFLVTLRDGTTLMGTRNYRAHLVDLLGPEW